MTGSYGDHLDNTSPKLGERETGYGSLCIIGILLSIIALPPVVDAGCCSAGTWDPSEFLKTEVDSQTGQPLRTQNDSAKGPEGSTPEPLDRSDSFPNGQILKPMKSVSSSNIVLDVSNGDTYAASHIKNAIHVPAAEFLDRQGNLKEMEDLAKILGDAGLLRDDSIVLYGTAESSGEAQLAFLVLSYLGQRDVKLLDGSLTDWKAAGLPVEGSENKKPAVEYKPEVKPALLADYEYVKSGQPQIVDVRPFVDFGMGRIPGSVALDPANVIKGDRIKDGSELALVFGRLNRDQPIVVYSSDYSRSSLVWCALLLMGYKASVYTWEDWKRHEDQDAQEAAAKSGGPAAGSRYTKLSRT